MSRLDAVTITYSRGAVVLPGPARDALLAEIGHLDSTASIVRTFGAVGASAPVKLSREDTATLVTLLDEWSMRASVDALPEGVWDLRCALHDEQYDTRDE